jgi:hypothetical protein
MTCAAADEPVLNADRGRVAEDSIFVVFSRGRLFGKATIRQGLAA